MTPPTERREDIDATSAPSTPSAVDETAATTGAAGTAVGGFGPPAAAGEVGTLGPYRVVKELGKGGMGAVYAALDTRLDRRLALKVMLPQFAADTACRERFLREARAAARVKHDNVVTVYEADERSGVPYIAMEYLEGYPLDEYLKKKGNPTPAQALKLAAETAAGLAAAHRQGLVHRDVKPGNLWLEAPAGRVKVLDFGLARPVDAEVELTKSGAIVGTPAYMSPEQARGEKVDSRTDLFSLGAVLYRLVTGRLPFQAPNTMAMLIALGTEEPPAVRDLNPTVPVALADLIHQLLSKVPANRPASADDVVKRLRAIAQAKPSAASTAAPAPAASQVVYVPIQVTALPEANPFADLDATEAEPVPTAAPAKPRRTWAVAAGLAALVLLVFGGVVIIIRNRDGTETRIEVPDGATVEVKGKDGKTLAKVGPKGAPAGKDDSADRKAAEYVLSVGGAVSTDGGKQVIYAGHELPRELFRLTNVYLNDKAITDDGLAKFAGCAELVSIALDRTKVTDAGLAHLRDCKSLTSLTLAGTAITDAGLTHVRNFPRLVQVDLGGTAVTDAGLAGVAACRDLSILGLANTQVTDEGLARFREHQAVSKLGLTNTKVTDGGLAHLKGWTVLNSLWLDGTGVTDAGLAHLAGFKQLGLLNVAGTKVTDAGLVHLKERAALTHLWLGGTAVTDAGLAHLHGCKELMQLGLTGTKVTANGLADFHAAVPGCRIEHDGGVIEPVDADRKAAEWVLSVGGSVVVGGGAGRRIGALGDLPRDHFTLAAAVLTDTAAVDADLLRLRHCRELREVDVTATKVTDAGLSHLADFPGLAAVYAGKSAATDVGLGHLTRCPHLATLYLAGTRVTDRGLADLTRCKVLSSLTLADTAVTDAGLADLRGCKSLLYLDVKGTKTTAKGVADFHAAVPGCRVAHDGGVIEAVDVDRRAAEWVLSAGKHVTVSVNGDVRDVKAVAELPREAFTLVQSHLSGAPAADAGLAAHRGCRGLEVLQLSGSTVTDAGLAHVHGCLRLRNLLLNRTAVTDAGLAGFGGCTGLTELLLEETKVTDAGLAVAKNFPQLRVLGATSTTIGDAGLAHLRGLAKLERLELGGTPVTDAGLAHLKDCGGLKYLTVDGTAVTDTGLVHLGQCKGLGVLAVRRTKVTAKGLADFHAAVPGCRVFHDGGVIEAVNLDRAAAEYVLSVGGSVGVNDGDVRSPIAAAADLPRGAFVVIHAELAGKAVTDAGLAPFRGCGSLSRLVLSDTKVTDAGLAHFRGCTKLNNLTLVRTATTDAGLAHFQDCTALAYLVLAGTKTTDAGLAHFKDRAALLQVDLSGTAVTDAGLAHLHGCRGLTTLTVRGTRVTAAGLAAFHAAVPGCRVEHDGGVIEPKT